MKLECNKGKLLKAISKADKVVSKGSSLPVLSCIVLETKEGGLTIKATNLEIGLKIFVQAKVLKEGVVAVPSNLLVSYVNSLSVDEDLVLEVNENILFVSGSQSETKINTLPVDDFPDIPNTSGEHECKISSKELVEGLKAVWYSASVTSMKPELSSVYIYPNSGDITFVATDSFRLAEKKIRAQTENFESVLIPQRNIGEIIRVFDGYDTQLTLNFEEDKISLSSNDDIYLISRVVDGNFPDYNQIIPKDNTTEVTVLKNDLQNSLKISNLFSNNFNQVNFSVDSENSVFEILSKNAEKGESRNTVSSTVRGEALEINFNQKYIIDAFSSISSESIVMNFNGKGKPMVIKGVNDDSFRYLVMPLNK
jgi:DNA polymerase-3 subunit beta